MHFFTLDTINSFSVEHQLSLFERITYFYTHPLILVSLIIFVSILVFYYWKIIKKYNFFGEASPVPRQLPPRKLGPGALRYLWYHVFDSDCLVVAILNAVIHNCYRIKWGKNSFKISLTQPALFSNLKGEEKAALSYRNKKPVERLSISDKKNQFSDRAEERMQGYLKIACKDYMLDRMKLLIIGIAASVIAAIILVILSGKYIYIMTVLIYVGIVGPALIGGPFLMSKFREINNWGIVIMLGVIMLIVVAVMLSREINSFEICILPMLIPFIVVNVWAYYKLPYYTEEGNRLRTEIEEFRAFLSERMSYEDKLKEDEAYLIPYLIALDIDFDNSDYFRSLLSGYKMDSGE